MSPAAKHARDLVAGARAWDRTTQVVVVGAGLAGYSAALEAAACGARVLLIEKQDAHGGSSLLSGGAIAFAGTDEQRALVIEDSPQRLYDDLRRVGEFKNDAELVRVYAARQLETYRWLKALGTEFGSVQLGGGQSVPRSHRAHAPQMMDALARAAGASRSIDVLAGCAAQRLVCGHGRVLGLVASCAGGAKAFGVQRGVVLATGGFSRCESLLRMFAPPQAAAQRIGGPGCTGDGLRMAWALGAGLRDMGYIKGTYGSHPHAGAEENALVHAIYRGAIAVNRQGRRFVDESLSYKLIGDACLQQPGAVGWQIFDAAIMARSVDGVVSADLRGAQRLGRVDEAHSLEALAAKAGIDARGLIATVAQYNHGAREGWDALFGRIGLGGGYGRMVPICHPPYYAYACTSAVLATYCGLSVDGEARVLDVFGAPIPGLFAAGEVTGGFHGVAYMTGSALGKAAVFGRIAGRSAARFIAPSRAS